MLRMGSNDANAMLFCSCLHVPGIICPSSFSISNIPFGEYLEEEVLLFLKNYVSMHR